MTAVSVESLLFEPLALRFVQFGMLAAVLTLLAGAAAGFHVVARHEAYLGSGVGQSMIAGIALGGVTGLPLAPSAFVGALVGIGAVALCARVRGVETDTAIAIVSTTMLSVGVAAISMRRDRAVNVSNVLFGNVLGVDVQELGWLALATTAAWTLAWWSGRATALVTVNQQVAAAHGVRIHKTETLRLVSLAATVATAVQVVGVALVVTALVLPVATAMRCTRSFAGLHATAAAVAVLTGVVGMYVSYHADIPSGPAIVLVGVVGFFGTVAATTNRT